MSKSMLEMFDDLMCHLNGEENELAQVFKAKLAIHLVNVKSHERDLDFLRALKSHGVDNWDGYSDAYCEAYGDDEEDEDDE